jgi:hypothetical protein
MDEQTASDWVVNAIRGEMGRRGLSYRDLAERLATIGVEENERNLRNKVARGTFSATFWVQCMVAMGVASVAFDGLVPERKEPISKDEILAEIERLMASKGG